MRLKNMKYMKHMMYKDHKEPKNSMYGTQNKLFFFFHHFSSKNMVVWRRSGLTGHSQKSMYRRMPKNPITSPIFQSMSHTLPNTPNHIQQYPYPQIYPIISCNIPTLSPLYLKTSRFYLQNILFRSISKVSYMNYFMLLPNFSQNLLFFTQGKLSFRSPTMTAARHRAASARPLWDRWSPSVVPSPGDVPSADPGGARSFDVENGSP